MAEEINKSADKTGVRATFTVETRGMAAVRAGTTSNDFAINGVTIGQVAYEDGDGNGALVAAINSVKDTTGVEASIDANGQLLLTSREGRGIKIDGDIGGGAFINANILGDSLYGYKGKYDCRIMLHAYFLYFIHPKTKEQIFVKAPLMEDFKNIMFEQINLGENDEKISLEFLLEFFNSFA